MRLKSRDKLLNYLVTGTILLGVILRIAVWLQNRNLIIDEANVARNIYERGFAQLLLPLSYEQYAPPVFLWFVKLCSVLFGFGEVSLRLYALVTGIGALFVFWLLLKELLPARAMWYALILFASAHILLRYSSELKQYMGDVLMVLSLMLLALKVKLREWKPGSFALLWILAGSIAIWTSMPSVFMLAAVGLYYFRTALTTKDYRRQGLLVVCSLLWLVQFGLYYWFILRPQANSDYLQNFHRDYFIHVIPSDGDEHSIWAYNWNNFSALMRTFGSEWNFGPDLVVNIILLVTGAIVVIRHHKEKAILLLTPVVLLFVASALRQFSLLPRVSLFVIPLLLLIMSFAVERCFDKFGKGARALLVLVLSFNIACGNALHVLFLPFKTEQLTDGLELAKAHNISGSDLLIYHSGVPALEYYTGIHPAKQRWEFAADADRLLWNTDYDSLARAMKYIWKIDRPFALIATNISNTEAQRIYKLMSYHFTTLHRVDEDYLRVYIFRRE